MLSTRESRQSVVTVRGGRYILMALQPETTQFIQHYKEIFEEEDLGAKLAISQSSARQNSGQSPKYSSPRASDDVHGFTRSTDYETIEVIKPMSQLSAKDIEKPIRKVRLQNVRLSLESESILNLALQTSEARSETERLQLYQKLQTKIEAKKLAICHKKLSMNKQVAISDSDSILDKSCLGIDRVKKYFPQRKRKKHNHIKEMPVIQCEVKHPYDPRLLPELGQRRDKIFGALKKAKPKSDEETKAVIQDELYKKLSGAENTSDVYPKDLRPRDSFRSVLQKSLSRIAEMHQQLVAHDNESNSSFRVGTIKRQTMSSNWLVTIPISYAEKQANHLGSRVIEIPQSKTKFKRTNQQQVPLYLQLKRLIDKELPPLPTEQPSNSQLKGDTPLAYLEKPLNTKASGLTLTLSDSVPLVNSESPVSSVTNSPLGFTDLATLHSLLSIDFEDIGGVYLEYKEALNK